MNYLPTISAAAEVLFISNNGLVAFFGRSPCWKEQCETTLQCVEDTNIMLPFIVNYNPNQERTVAADRNSFSCSQCCCCCCFVAGVCRDDNLFLFYKT